MAKRKKNKNKVVKLSDEQYSAYIMALKDETPPSLYVDAHKKDCSDNGKEVYPSLFGKQREYSQRHGKKYKHKSR